MPAPLVGQRVVCASVAWYHTIVSTAAGLVYVWGKGESLGYDEDVWTPQEVALLM